jgi:predicted nucleic acid-binding protein
VDAFDSDVLIYASTVAHPLGRRVRQLFEPVDESDAGTAGVGSVVLLPELLAKPRRDGNRAAESALDSLLARLELLPLDLAVAELATAIAARYRLRASDAIHLATGVHASADRFITNNQRDFPTTITEIEVVYPSMLPDPV